MNKLLLSAISISAFLALQGLCSPSAAQESARLPLASLYESIPGQPRITSDGAGGAIITWADHRGGNWDIYAQRVNGAGSALWAGSGVAVCSEPHSQQSPQIVPDGAGGAIVAWADLRGGEYDIYAQGIDAAGAVRWAAGGVAVCSEPHNQQYPQLAPDGAGGAIVAWVDFRKGNDDIYAQRISAAGTLRWAAKGVAVCSEAHSQQSPQIAVDGAGGAVITWIDYRSGNSDIYAQHVRADGSLGWTSGGVGVCTGTQSQVAPQIASDGAGGAIIAWVDYRSLNYDIYAQRVDAKGAALWSTNGIGVCTVMLDQVSPQIIPDGAGGAIVTWADRRSGDWDVYAQRLNANGAFSWIPDGIGVCTAMQDQFSPQIASDGAGGAIITWMDSRGGNNNIFAQRVDAHGFSRWTANGITVCFERHDQRYPQIVSDGAGGVIITWADFRAGTYDIYAQRVDPDGVYRWAPNGIPVRSGS